MQVLLLFVPWGQEELVSTGFYGGNTLALVCDEFLCVFRSTAEVVQLHVQKAHMLRMFFAH